MLRHERDLDEQAVATFIHQTLEEDLLRIILRAIRGAAEELAKFVLPIGTQEIHSKMSLEPLNLKRSTAGMGICCRVRWQAARGRTCGPRLRGASHLLLAAAQSGKGHDAFRWERSDATGGRLGIVGGVEPCSDILRLL